MKQETTNFILFHHGRDTQDLNELANTLEGSYKRITSILGVVPPKKTHVHIYASQSDFHQAIGRPNAESWVVGTVTEGEIHMVSPRSPVPEYDSDDIMSIAIHEFVHIVAEELSLHTTDNRPFLSEGLATYLAGQESQLDTDMEMPNAEEIISSCQGDFAYQIGFVFIRFIASKFGNAGLVALYKDPDGFARNNTGLDEMWLNECRLLQPFQR